MSRVLMLVLNPMTADSRVHREAAALAGAGHDVTVVATAAQGLPAQEARAGYRVLRLQYRRVVKDAVVGRSRALAGEGSERRRAVQAVSTPAQDALVALHTGLAVGHQVAGKLTWLAGGAFLKIVRSLTLPFEYWQGSIARLPRFLPRCDAIHAHDLGTLAAAVRLARVWRPSPRVIYDSHELYVEQRTRWKPYEKLLWRLHETRWIRHADLVITVSDGIADELVRRYRLRRRPLVLFNSPDVGDHPSGRGLRADMTGAAEAPVVAYAGAVKPGRGVELLVDALTHADAWHLALVGPAESPHLEDLRAQAARAGVAHRLHVLPPVPAGELPAYLRDADLGVHPLEPTCLNHELAMPNKMFDYAFAGVPLAVSRLKEMTAFVEDNRLGVTFDAHDGPAVAAAIDLALRNRDRLTPTPEALDRVKQRYGWPTQRRRLLTAYAALGLESPHD